MAELYSLHRVTLQAPGQPLFAALAAAVPGLSRRQAREAVVAGLVRIAGEQVLEPKHALDDQPAVTTLDLRQGLKRIRLAQRFAGAEGGAPARSFTIVHEDGALVVVDKAAGVLSAPTEAGERGHVAELLREHWRKQGRLVRFIGLIHRLDRETSGCLCFALTREAQRLCAAQFAAHSAVRTYRCLVMGRPRADHGRVEAKLGRGHDGRRAVVDDETPGKSAVTHWRVLRRFALGAELEVRLETGRTHQIRVHLASLGCPVYGDRVYARNWKPTRGEPPAPKAPRLMLHAERLEIDHPLTGKRLKIVAPMPEVFAQFCEQMG